MAKLTTNSAYKSAKNAFANVCDNELRSFSATVKTIKAHMEDSNGWYKEVANRYLLKEEMFSMDFIRENLPLRFDSNGKFCCLKKVEAGTGKESFPEFEVREYKDFDHVCIPKYKFTTKEVITLVEAAVKAKTANAKAEINLAKAVVAEKRAKERQKALKAQLAKSSK